MRIEYYHIKNNSKLFNENSIITLFQLKYTVLSNLTENVGIWKTKAGGQPWLIFIR